MGDRALVMFHNGTDVSPVVYLHWNGSDVGSLLAATRVRMVGREGDVGYTTARFVGLAHERIPGNLSLGIMPGPATLADAYDVESHGDAGVFLVDCRTWRRKAWGGYGIRRGKKATD